MAAKLNERAYEHARDLIAARRYLIDDRDAWSEHQPSAEQENDYIERHGIAEYAMWHLGIDDEKDDNRKGATSSRTATFRTSIVAGCSPRNPAPDNAGTTT
jgi:hypothetical protein